MGTKVWPVALLMLLLLAFVGFWLSLSASAAKKVKKDTPQLIYDVQMPASVQGHQTDQQRLLSQAVEIIKKRLDASLGEGIATVKVVDISSIGIYLPKNQKLDDVRPLIETQANAQLMWAKNVMTSNDTGRRYRVEKWDGPGGPTFVDQKGTSQVPYQSEGPFFVAMMGGWTPILDSEDIATCTADSSTGRVNAKIGFTSTGNSKLEAWCRKNASLCENIAFVFDGKVVCIAPLKEGTVLSGTMVLGNELDEAFVKRLCMLISIGKMPVKVVERKAPSTDPSKRPFG